MRWFKISPFRGSGVLGWAVLTRSAFQAILRWSAGIAVPRRYLMALGTSKGDGLGANGADVSADDESLRGHRESAAIFLIVFVILRVNSVF